MPCYEELYHDLFNGITNIIEEMNKTIEHMKDLQIQAENKYLAFREWEESMDRRFHEEVLDKYYGKPLSSLFDED